MAIGCNKLPPIKLNKNLLQRGRLKIGNCNATQYTAKHLTNIVVKKVALPANETLAEHKQLINEMLEFVVSTVATATITVFANIPILEMFLVGAVE